MLEVLSDKADIIGLREPGTIVPMTVPILTKAIQCVDNSVNLIVQGELQPYIKDHMNEMHLHKLQWPRWSYGRLGETEVSFRVTLSYFIELGP